MGGCASAPSAPAVADLEFVDATETEADAQALLQRLTERLESSGDIIDRLKSFRGCSEQIKEALATPNQTNQDAAWQVVVPAVEILKDFYNFSVVIEEVVTELLTKLAAGTVTADTLSEHAGLTKTLAQVLDFVLQFDDAKMTNPAIQNVFSYYRRQLNRMKMANNKSASELPVDDEMANAMSLFYAYPTPMMNAVIKATNNLIDKSTVSNANVSTLLAILTNSCVGMAERHKYDEATLHMLAVRAAAGSVILYDHVNDRGAFHRRTPIQILRLTQVIRALANHDTDTLLNSLRFNTIHLSDEDVPRTTAEALA